MTEMARDPVVQLRDGAARRTTGLLTGDVLVVDDPAADERVLWEGIR